MTQPTPPQPQALQTDEPTLPPGIDIGWLQQLNTALGLHPETYDPELILAAARDAAADGQNGPSQVAASAKRLGMELIDADSITALRNDAQEGRRVLAAAQRKERETAVDAAIREGRITPSRREHWLKLIEADPGMADVLASTPAGTAVPLSTIGHNYSADAASHTGGPTWFPGR